MVVKARGKRKPVNPFICDEGGELYVRSDAAGMSPMIPYMDGIPVCTFKNSRHVYLKARHVLEWHRRELTETRGRVGSAVVCKVLPAVMASAKTPGDRLTAPPLAGEPVYDPADPDYRPLAQSGWE